MTMLWLQVLAYFVIWSILMVASFAAYAKLLRFVARFSDPIKLLLGLTIYIVFACILVLPLAGLAMNEKWRLAVNSSSAFAVAFLGGYLLAMVPGAVYFRRRHMDALKGLGYFQNRPQR
ncbi:MAG: hypothetical protein K2X64_00545 [Rhodocyclaceae bacterium]|nr:hypothetical protein [Rhodocyclaceae bacterium]